MIRKATIPTPASCRVVRATSLLATRDVFIVRAGIPSFLVFPSHGFPSRGVTLNGGGGQADTQSGQRVRSSAALGTSAPMPRD